MREGRLGKSASVSRAAAVSLALVVLASCGSSTHSSAPTMTGTVTTSISDPPTCMAQFSNVWVTITKVTAHINGDASPGDSGWVTLVDLTSSPMQIDLLSL